MKSALVFLNLYKFLLMGLGKYDVQTDHFPLRQDHFSDRRSGYSVKEWIERCFKAVRNRGFDPAVLIHYF